MPAFEALLQLGATQANSAAPDPAVLDLGTPGAAVPRAPYREPGVGEMLEVAGGAWDEELAAIETEKPAELAVAGR